MCEFSRNLRPHLSRWIPQCGIAGSCDQCVFDVLILGARDLLRRGSEGSRVGETGGPTLKQGPTLSVPLAPQHSVIGCDLGGGKA